MSRYLLDTNIVSYITRNKSSRLNAIADEHLQDSCISAITEGEIRFGVIKNPAATSLAQSIETYLEAIPILPWDSDCAEAFAIFKTRLQKAGLSLSRMDMLIATHSIAIDAILVSNDGAFHKAAHLLKLENWMQ